MIRLPATQGQLSPFPESPPARTADRSASRYPRTAVSVPNPAGSHGGSFGFPLPKDGCSPSLNPAGSHGGSFGFPLPKQTALSVPNPAGSPGGSFGFPLPKDSSLASPIPPARPADRSASRYPG